MIFRKEQENKSFWTIENEHNYKMIRKIQKHLQEKGFKVALYTIDFEENQKIKELDDKKNQYSDYSEYYWLEFVHEDKKFAISLFYCDFDCSSGNIHTLPGVIQFWINDNKYSYLLDNKKNVFEVPKRGLKPYQINGFTPMLCRKYRVCSNELEMIINDFLLIIQKNTVKKIITEVRKLCKGVKCCELNVDELSARFNHMKSNLKLTDDKGVALKFKLLQSCSGRGNYKMYKWVRIECEGKIHWIIYSKCLDINGCYFFQHGKLQIWEDMGEKKGPNEKTQDGNWEWKYPSGNSSIRINL